MINNLFVCYFFLDYDECKKQEDNQCSQICQNVIGSFSCGCKKGFKLGPDEKTCLGMFLLRSIKGVFDW